MSSSWLRVVDRRHGRRLQAAVTPKTKMGFRERENPKAHAERTRQVSALVDRPDNDPRVSYGWEIGSPLCRFRASAESVEVQDTTQPPARAHRGPGPSRTGPIAPPPPRVSGPRPAGDVRISRWGCVLGPRPARDVRISRCGLRLGTTVRKRLRNQPALASEPASWDHGPQTTPKPASPHPSTPRLGTTARRRRRISRCGLRLGTTAAGDVRTSRWGLRLGTTAAGDVRTSRWGLHLGTTVRKRLRSQPALTSEPTSKDRGPQTTPEPASPRPEAQRSGTTARGRPRKRGCPATSRDHGPHTTPRTNSAVSPQTHQHPRGEGTSHYSGAGIAQPNSSRPDSTSR